MSDENSADPAREGVTGGDSRKAEREAAAVQRRVEADARKAERAAEREAERAAKRAAKVKPVVVHTLSVARTDGSSDYAAAWEVVGSFNKLSETKAVAADYLVDDPTVLGFRITCEALPGQAMYGKRTHKSAATFFSTGWLPA